MHDKFLAIFLCASAPLLFLCADLLFLATNCHKPRSQLQNSSPCKIALLTPFASKIFLLPSRACSKNFRPNPLRRSLQRSSKSSIFLCRGVLQLPLDCINFLMSVYTQTTSRIGFCRRRLGSKFLVFASRLALEQCRSLQTQKCAPPPWHLPILESLPVYGDRSV